MKTHYGDPCLHCATPHDAVVIGPCPGPASKAVPIAKCFISQRWDRVVHWKLRYSDGRIDDVRWHIEEIPNLLLSRLRWDETLKKATP